MAIYTVRRLASDILGVGENRIRMKPDQLSRVKEALTRGDVITLIRDGVVYKIAKQGRRKIEKRPRRGFGRIRGKATINKKEEWMARLRAQRKYLKELVANGSLDKKYKRKIYGKVKSGAFKTKKTLVIYLKENGIYTEKIQKTEKTG